MTENCLKLVEAATTLDIESSNVGYTNDEKSEVENVKSKSEVEKVEKVEKNPKTEVSKSGGSESIESLREEIDQLLAPILTNQNEIVVVAKQRTISPDDSEHFLIRFGGKTETEKPETSNRVQEERSRRSPSGIISDFIEAAIIENSCPNNEKKNRVNF